MQRKILNHSFLKKIDFTESTIRNISTEYHLSQLRICINYENDFNYDYEILIKGPFELKLNSSYEHKSDPRFHFTISSIEIDQNQIEIKSFVNDEVKIIYTHQDQVKVVEIKYIPDK